MEKKNARLIARREAMGMSQGEAAKAVGVSRQNYNRYECGGAQPLAERACIIAKVFGTTVEALWGTGG